MEKTAHSELEIDLLTLVKKLWSRKFFIIFIAGLFGTAALAYSLFLVTPLYQSTTRIYVVNQNSNNNTLTTQDLQVGDYLVKDYREIILSKDVMLAVMEKAVSEGIPEDDVITLSDRVSVNSPVNTRVISISVTDANPDIASHLANAIREESALKIKDVTKVEEVTTLEIAEPAEAPASPNLKRNALLGILLGGFLSTVGVVVKELLDDRVKRPEDIEEVLGMTLLGLVPDESQLK
ncbi:Wzz/FepE/Etk N-terminal domain-containing protein [Streptococcus fryi]